MSAPTGEVDLTASDDRTVSIGAPRALVGDEVDGLGMLAYLSDVDDYEIAPGGRIARLEAVVGVGRHRFDLAGRAEVIETSDPDLTGVHVEVPELRLRYRGTFRLAADGPDATSLTYRARIECAHPAVTYRRDEVHRRLHEHVIDLTDRIVTYCENHPVARRTREEPGEAAQAAGPAPIVLHGPRDAPWRVDAEARLRSRLRRLVEEADPDERRTAVWTALDHLSRSLRQPLAAPVPEPRPSWR